jgi:hypothetical protein
MPETCGALSANLLISVRHPTIIMPRAGTLVSRCIRRMSAMRTSVAHDRHQDGTNAADLAGEKSEHGKRKTWAPIPPDRNPRRGLAPRNSLAPWSSPQYTRLGRRALRLGLYTSKSTSLGTVLNAATTRAFGIILASSSAPDEVCATTSSAWATVADLIAGTPLVIGQL